MAVCTVCSKKAARALVDGSLAAGMTPIETFRAHGEGLGLSLSAVYRHARAHRPHSALSVKWLGDTPSGEIIADVSRLHRSHLEQREAAILRGDHTTASREGHEASTTGAALLKAGIEDHGTAEQLENHTQLQRILQRAALREVSITTTLAAAARELRFEDFATDFEQLAVAVADHLATPENKENN